MPSFDIVSKTDLSEVTNALAAMTREIQQRFDFKGSQCSIERKEETLTVLADDDMKLRQMHELLKVHLTRRNVDARALEYKTPEKASGNTLRQVITVRQGIEQPIAKKITAAIKDSKMKVQAAIQGDAVRVTGKKRDDLQEAIAMIKGLELDLPLQFENFRD
ncbi:MAG: YajQ family cyclic di-GMP-binding protein [Proteobacteria bacterium]|nr:YajQ family cyclic di-GMP-binding protein [Pseudomonadota bacterium]